VHASPGKGHALSQAAAQLCPGGLADPFLSTGDAAEVWEASKAVEFFPASHQPCATPSQSLSSQVVVTTTQPPQREARSPRGRGWRDHQPSPPDLLLTDIQPRTPQTEPSNLVFFQAGSQPTFGDIKRWRINRRPWERAPIINRPREQTPVPPSQL